MVYIGSYAWLLKKYLHSQQKIFDTIQHPYYNNIENNPLFRELRVIRPENQQKGANRTMKSTGIIRKVDELGRIVLPIELRRTLDIAERDELEIYMEGDRIILQKYEPSCVFCASSRNLFTHNGKNVCRECVQTMSKY